MNARLAARMAPVALVAFLLGAIATAAVTGSTARQPVHLSPGEYVTIYADAPTAAPTPSPTPSGPACSAASAGSYWVVTTTGLTPSVNYAAEYGLWWSVAHVDDGQPFYFASSNLQPADGNGTVRFYFDPRYYGYYSLHVYHTGYLAYDPANDIAACEATVVAP